MPLRHARPYSSYTAPQSHHLHAWAGSPIQGLQLFWGWEGHASYNLAMCPKGATVHLVGGTLS